jgi:hypothetical protein
MHPRPHWRGRAPPRSDRGSSPPFLALPLALDSGKFLNPLLEVGGKQQRSAATLHGA